MNEWMNEQASEWMIADDVIKKVQKTDQKLNYHIQDAEVEEKIF